jgi:hypothetical protein
MKNLHFSQDQLVQVAKLSDADMALIDECRGEQNKLGLGLLSTDMLGVIYDGFIHDLKWTIIIK